ncbi:hypothetical protein [Vibrio sp. Vb339]|uniref:hypothetical protein n=1 Tax=Vibrio sp. Vb339 TaxID=1192013 RepID=UPI0015526D5B|nr:hypothetical protein [Vibrio sp. Vb339]
MIVQKLFFVTDWKSYAIVEAESHELAISCVFNKKRYICIPQQELTELTVIHAMSCEYRGLIKFMVEKCGSNLDKILVIGNRPETQHFQIETS